MRWVAAVCLPNWLNSAWRGFESLTVLADLYVILNLLFPEYEDTWSSK